MADTTTPATKTTKSTKSGYRSCRCSEYFICKDVEVNGQPDFDERVDTGCTKHVAGKTDFAPGHDAKLKSLLILAKRTGREVKQEHGGVLIHHVSPETAAAEYGFGYMVARASTTKPSRKAAVKPEPTVRAKVGRWTYEGIEHPDGTFAYVDNKGQAKVTSKFTRV